MRNILKTVLPVLLFALLLFSSAGCNLSPRYVHAKAVATPITEKITTDTKQPIQVAAFQDLRSERKTVGRLKTFGYAHPILLDGEIEEACTRSTIDALLRAGANAILVGEAEQDQNSVSGIYLQGKITDILVEYKTKSPEGGRGIARIVIELDIIRDGQIRQIGPIVGESKGYVNALHIEPRLNEFLAEAMANCFGEMIRELNKSKALGS